MGRNFTEPPGYPNADGFRLVDMFTAASTAQKKEEISDAFVKTEGRLRLIIATTSFGMGIDCPNIMFIGGFLTRLRRWEVFSCIDVSRQRWEMGKQKDE